MKGFKRRVLTMEARERAQQPDRDPSHLIVMPDDWPEEDCRAYDVLHASGEHAV